MSAHNELCESIVSHLKWRGWRTWRLFAPGRRSTSAGLPDLLARKASREVWVEVKTGTDRLTPEQRAFFASGETIPGVEHYEVRAETLDDFLKRV